MLLIKLLLNAFSQLLGHIDLISCINATCLDLYFSFSVIKNVMCSTVKVWPCLCMCMHCAVLFVCSFLFLSLLLFVNQC